MQKLDALLKEYGLTLVPSFTGNWVKNGGEWLIGRTLHTVGKTTYLAWFGDYKRNLSEFWRSEEPVSPDECAAMEEAMREMNLRLNEEREKAHADTALEVQRYLLTAYPRGRTPYMDRKKIDALYGAKVDHDEKTLLIPLQDIEGRVWSYQSIFPEKRQLGKNLTGKIFLGGGKISGCFHPLCALPGEDYDQAIYIAEGWATAASIHMAMKMPTVTAFNAGNMSKVGAQLRLKYPNAILVFCADDDRHTKMPDGTFFNTGVDAAKRAASNTSGYVVVPRFEDPASLCTDFNDLHCGVSLDEVRKQLEAGLLEATTKAVEILTTNLGSGFNLSPVPWTKTKTGMKPPPYQKVADALFDYYGGNLLRQEDDLFTYVGTHWKALQKQEYQQMLRQLQFLYSGQAKFSQLGDMYKLFCLSIPSAPVDLYAPRPDYANFLDGTLTLVRGSDYKWKKYFNPHRREDYLINCIPLEYKKAKDAVNAPFLDMLQRVFDGDADKDQKIRAIRQMYGACLAPLKPRLFLLHGPTGSGKTSLILPAMRLVSKENQCSVQPHELIGFNMADMIGKLVNFRTDINTTIPIEDDTIKVIEDRVSVRIDRKFKESVNVPLPAIHILGGNSKPVLRDGASGAHTRRWTFIKVSAHKTELGNYMHDYGNWLFEQEPHGILAFAIEGLDDLLETNHYTTPDSGLADIANWQRMSDQVGQFLYECEQGEVQDNNTQVLVGSQRRIHKPRLWVLFTEWAKTVSGKHPVLSRHKFYSAIRERGFAVVKTKNEEEWAGIGTREITTGGF